MSFFVAVALLLLVNPDAGVSAVVPPPAIPKQVVANSQIRVLPRSANGRDYQLYVALPPSYETAPTRRYPVLYICDGYWDFALINGFYGGLLYDRDAPEIIVVGFGYPGVKPDFGALRQLDYTPAPNPNDPKSKLGGHAGAFLSVVEKEFIPFVEREYRVDPSYRVLGGSSLGGLFTLFAMFERRGLFQGYIAPSPATDWAQNWLFRREAAFAAQYKDLPVRLFLSGASEEGLLPSILRFKEQLESRHYAGLQVKWRLVDGERHAGTKPESYNRGIRFVFAPRAPSPNEK
jgi:uncharacterized protein